jgi:hypothetical protein
MKKLGFVFAAALLTVCVIASLGVWLNHQGGNSVAATMLEPRSAYQTTLGALEYPVTLVSNPAPVLAQAPTDPVNLEPAPATPPAVEPAPRDPINYLQLALQIAAVLTTVITWGAKRVFGLEGINVLTLNGALNVLGKGIVLYATGAYGAPGTQEAILLAVLVTVAGFGADQGIHGGIKRAEEKTLEVNAKRSRRGS